MDLTRIIADLQTELSTLNESILALERLAAGGHRGRGRPPKWLAETQISMPKRRGRPPGVKNKAKDRIGE